MAFSHHEACPKCRETGGDSSGNNLAVYTNGSAFCFACHYMRRATGWEPPKEKGLRPPPDDLSVHFKQENLEWLRQYLEDGEIIQHFRYSAKLGMHIFRHGNYWEGRSVNPKQVTSHGEKPFIVFGREFPVSSPIVVVEDVVSAIKVSRQFAAVPLFGSFLSPEWMVKLVKLRPQRIVVWLDSDKIRESRGAATKLNTLAPGIAASLSTNKDPKAYDDLSVKSLIGLYTNASLSETGG